MAIPKSLIIIFIFLILAPLYFCVYGYCIENNDTKQIKAFVVEEYNDVSKTLKSVKEKKDAVWAEGDISYYHKWLKGLEFERAGKYQFAIKWYKLASKVCRYEMSTYNIYLPLGRAYFLNQQRNNALNALKYFIEHCEAEISGEENQEWGLSEEGEIALKKDLEFAKWLVTLCRDK